MQKKILAICVLFLIVINISLSAEEITGFWKTLNDKTGKAESIIAIYPYEDKYYGRIILTYEDDGSLVDTLYEPRIKAPGVIGDAFYSGMDIIWDMKKVGSNYEDGKILDPENGEVYDAEMWREGDNLIVRGEILFFGRNQTWLPAAEKDFPSGFKKPDLSTLKPKIPQVKEKL